MDADATRLPYLPRLYTKAAKRASGIVLGVGRGGSFRLRVGGCPVAAGELFHSFMFLRVLWVMIPIEGPSVLPAGIGAVRAGLRQRV